MKKKKTRKRKPQGELRREYKLADLKGCVRGKYAARYKAGTNLAVTHR
jgi:hypothetical protein